MWPSLRRVRSASLRKSKRAATVSRLGCSATALMMQQFNHYEAQGIESARDHILKGFGCDDERTFRDRWRPLMPERLALRLASKCIAT